MMYCVCCDRYEFSLKIGEVCCDVELRAKMEWEEFTRNCVTTIQYIWWANGHFGVDCD